MQKVQKKKIKKYHHPVGLSPIVVGLKKLIVNEETSCGLVSIMFFEEG